MQLFKIVDHDEEGENENKKDGYKPELPVLFLQLFNILHRAGGFIHFIDGFPLGGFSKEFPYIHSFTQLKPKTIFKDRPLRKSISQTPF